MITMTATIDILKSGTGTGESGMLSDLSCNLSGNNISNGISALKAVKRRIKRPFILGKSKLGIGDTYCKELDYYMGAQLANDYGVFENPYSITINGTSITAITLAFDDLNNRFPKSITVDGQTYIDDDPKWTIINLTQKDTHTVTINNWNIPNEPLILSGIYIDVSIDLDRRNLTGIDFSIMQRSDTTKPSWGIISNSGTIRFNDIDGEVKDYAEQFLLQSGLGVKIFLNNTLADESQIIGVFKTSEWNYDKYSRAVNLSIKDDLEKWQNIKLTQKIEFFNKTMIYVYNYLVSKTPKYYSFKTLSNDITAYLSNIKSPILISGEESLWNKWYEFCDVCGLYLFKNKEGNIEIQKGIKDEHNNTLQ